MSTARGLKVTKTMLIKTLHIKVELRAIAKDVCSSVDTAVSPEKKRINRSRRCLKEED